MPEICIRNARILPMEGAEIADGFVLVRDGRIADFGPASGMPDGADAVVIDAAGGCVTPGLIDVHSHLGLYEDSLGFEGSDVNEDTDPVTPQLRVIDGINPMDRAFRESLEAGVTAVVVSPGSANPIGGQMALVRTWGRCIDQMVLKAPVGMKFALGENPKSVYHDKDEAPVTRMATAALIRENLRKAQEYHARRLRADEDEPDYDAKLEALEQVITGSLPAHIHAHRADDMFTGLRICREFDIRPVLVHGTEGHLVADLLAGEGVPVISGPFMTDRSKPELHNLTEASPALLAAAGVPVAITTDHPEVPVKYLRLAAAVAVQAGMDETEALRAITINGARIVGCDDRIGSIAPGKDADLVVWSGHPLDFRSHVRAVVCAGQLVYRRNNDENH